MSLASASRFINSALLAVTFAAAAGPARAADAAVTRPLDADRMIAQCLQYAAAQKLPALSVGVIDASGALLSFKRQHGASSVSADVALLKARTAMRLNLPTSVLGDVPSDAATRDVFLMLQMTTIAGGIPLADKDGNVVGAVGVSGAAPEQDADCARRAADAAQASR